MRKPSRLITLMILSVTSLAIGGLVAIRSSFAELILYSLVYGLLICLSLTLRLDLLLSAYLFLVLAFPLWNYQLPDFGTIEILGRSVHVYDIAMLVLGGSWVVRLLIRQKRLRLTNVYLPLGLFFLWAIISSVIGLQNGNNPKLVISDWLAAMPYFVLVPASVTAFDRPQEQAKMISLTIVGAMIINGVITTLVTFWEREHWLANLYPQSAIQYRVGSASTGIALWAAVISLQGLVHFPFKGRRLMRLFFVLSLLLSLYLSLASMSRTLIFSLIVAIGLSIIVVCLGRSKFILSRAFYLPILFTILFVLVNLLISAVYKEATGGFVQILRERLESPLTEEDLEPRVDFYRIGLPLLRSNPLGLGAGVVWVFFDREIIFMDNLYWTVLLKYGFPGLLFLVWFFGLVLIKAVRIWRNAALIKNTYAFLMSISVVTLLPVILLMNLNLAHLMYNRPTAITMALLIGWVINMEQGLVVLRRFVRDQSYLDPN